MPPDANDTLHLYLRDVRAIALWKLEGLSEYDVRRPLTPTGTNLLGLVKHLTTVELVYFGVAFDRVPVDAPAWFGQDQEPDSDMWATEQESRDVIVEGYRGACANSDATIAAVGPDAIGEVPWMGTQQATLHRLLVHVLSETSRHVGHLDILRETVDGGVGECAENDGLTHGGPPRDADSWRALSARIEQAAVSAADSVADRR